MGVIIETSIKAFQHVKIQDFEKLKKDLKLISQTFIDTGKSC